MTDARFRPADRVNHPGDFRRAFERKRSASDATVIVYAVENGLDHARLGISVGKKKMRKATARNRAKRILREAFRLSKAELPTGVDLIVVPRGVPLRFDETRAALPRLARSAAARLGPRPPKVTTVTDAVAWWRWPGRVAIASIVFAIRIYQRTLSRLLGPVCRFEPSCSNYMVGALHKYGLLRGSWRGIKRIARCHPWNPGGYDPP